MTITLTPEHEQWIAEVLQTGAYQNADDVIGRALEMLHAENEWLHDQQRSIEAKIERAFGQFERGEFLTAEQSRADRARRKEEWLANRHT